MEKEKRGESSFVTFLFSLHVLVVGRGGGGGQLLEEEEGWTQHPETLFPHPSSSPRCTL